MNWIWIWLLGSGFAFWETAYYGWNPRPHSDAELICDGIVGIIMALAILTRAIEKQNN